MSGRFPIVPLGTLAEIKGGKRLAKGEDLFETETEHPYIRARDIKGGSITFKEPVYLTPEVAQRLARYTVPSGAVCITIVGANVGDVGAVPPYLDGANLTENAVKVLARSSCDQRFLKFALLTNNAQDQMKALAGGAAQPKLGIYKIETVEVPKPPLLTQRKIAAVLSAYDDLIENNTRRIAILEEMARALYREWFVHFRFPGHETVKMVESELGMIPQGWEVARLGELADVVTKGTTPTTLGKKFQDTGVNFFKVESIDDTGGILGDKLAHIDQETHELLKRSQLKPGDILFSIAGAIGRCTLVPHGATPANTNQALAIIRIPGADLRLYLYQCVRADTFQNFSLGRVVQTAQANVSLGVLKSAPVVVPTRSVLTAFVSVISGFSEAQENLRKSNAALTNSRDLLLPKLISGEVDVSDLDIEVPDVPEVDEAGQVTREEQPQTPQRRGAFSPKRQIVKPAPPEKSDDSTPLVTPNGRSDLGGNIDDFKTNDVMAAFRQASRGRRRMSRDELIKATSFELGYQRLPARVADRIRDHLRAAIRRKIVGADGDEVWPETPDMASYERDELIAFLTSVMPIGRYMERHDVIRALANHLGFKRITDSVEQQIKSAINGAIRRGEIASDRSVIWRYE